MLLLDWEDTGEAQVRKKNLEGCDQDSIFWMVQIMESWFLADARALMALFKTNFGDLGNPNVEEIPKADVLARLNKLAGGDYHKISHGAKLLALIDPAKVRKAAPNCDRMFSVILAGLSRRCSQSYPPPYTFARFMPSFLL